MSSSLSAAQSLSRGRHRRCVLGLPLLIAAMTLLGGCSLLGKRGPGTAIFSLAPSINLAAETPVDFSIAVDTPIANKLLDTPRFIVEPEPGRLQVYKGVAWTQPVPDLVEFVIVRAFSDSDAILTVAPRRAGLRADYILGTDLRSFQAPLHGGPPRAVVSLQARLAHNASGAVVASKTFSATSPAGSNEAPALARAFETALGQVVEELVPWALQAGRDNAAMLAPAPAVNAIKARRDAETSN